MKQFVYYCGIAAAMIASTGYAQDVTVDDYELYADTAAVQANYISVAGNGAERGELGTSDGAEGTNQWLRLVDNGYTAGVGTGPNFVFNPPAGTYKLGFHYKNGIDGGLRWRGLKVTLRQGGAEKTSIIVNPGPDGTPAVTEWTYAETEPFTLDTSNIALRFDSGVGNGAAPTWIAAVDQIKLIPLTGPALSVFPDDRVYLSGQTTIRAFPEGGTPPYTVEFNVNNDASVEHTVNGAPGDAFEFVWNTLTDVPDGTSRTLNANPPDVNTPITVSIKVTDSEDMVNESIELYTVDNEFGGRESLLANGDFSQWQGTGSTENVPVGWNVNWVANTNPEYGIGEGRNSAAGDSLRIRLTAPTGEAEPFPDRYVLRSDAVQGRYRDQQTTFWAKGVFARLYYMTSEDGVTFTTTLVDAGVGDGSDWRQVVGLPRSPAALSLTDTKYTALGTHQLGTTEHFWDDIVWTGNLLPETSSVEGWNLY